MEKSLLGHLLEIDFVWTRWFHLILPSILPWPSLARREVKRLWRSIWEDRGIWEDLSTHFFCLKQPVTLLYTKIRISRSVVRCFAGTQSVLCNHLATTHHSYKWSNIACCILLIHHTSLSARKGGQVWYWCSQFQSWPWNMVQVFIQTGAVHYPTRLVLRMRVRRVSAIFTRSDGSLGALIAAELQGGLQVKPQPWCQRNRNLIISETQVEFSTLNDSSQDVRTMMENSCARAPIESDIWMSWIMQPPTGNMFSWRFLRNSMEQHDPIETLPGSDFQALHPGDPVFQEPRHMWL